MQQRRTKDQQQRIRQSRQVLSGDAVRPAPDPWQMADGSMPFSPLQRNFLLILGVMLILGALLAFTGHMMIATIPFVVLALGLVLARFVF